MKGKNAETIGLNPNALVLEETLQGLLSRMDRGAIDVYLV
jgi:hypothetical protein